MTKQKMNNLIALVFKQGKDNSKLSKSKTQPCPQCGYPIGIISGSNEAICKNCGFKDPCCE
ncbi:hypothetical protein HYS91_03865 [Candidatus Daviesbacteria bacterium]|nr:hypothetical protein [Candidatus Daviesbacteria bacterium]